MQLSDLFIQITIISALILLINQWCVYKLSVLTQFSSLICISDSVDYPYPVQLIVYCS
jgi:hypothetical protein